jgi:hypothetical protein
LSPEELKKLIGKEAVLVITNENLGKEVPLVVIREILPHTSQNLRWVNANEPKFRMSFAPNAEDIAIAA